jgi:hypothetical protein
VTFKPSTHRKCFIDRKIRENSCPTAVSLARDYQTEYGEKVGPRTIANDIAEMRRDFNAPIHYDSEKRGYVYTDPAFQADIFQNLSKDIPLSAVGVGGIAALGLNQELLPLIPASIFLSDWHRDILLTLVDKLSPGLKEKCHALGKISVIQKGDSSPFSPSEVEKVVTDCLEHNRELLLVYQETKGKVKEYLFRPIHLVYLETGQTETLVRFILGAVSSPESAPYALLKGDRIQKAVPSEKRFTPIKSIHIQPVNDTCLEFLLSYKHNDTILVFTHDTHSPSGEYSLLSRLDIYPQ